MYRIQITHAGDSPETIRALDYPGVLRTLAQRCYSGQYPEVQHVLVERADGKKGPKTASFVHSAYQLWRDGLPKKEQGR